MGGLVRNGTAETSETPGLPFGELFRERRHLRGDLRLLRRAIREGWPIAETSRDALVQAVSETAGPDALTDLPEGTRARAFLRGVACLLEMTLDDLAADYAEAGLRRTPRLTKPRPGYPGNHG